MKQMDSSGVEFLSGLELQSLWQAEEQSWSDNAIVEEVVETPLSL